VDGQSGMFYWVTIFLIHLIYIKLLYSSGNVAPASLNVQLQKYCTGINIICLKRYVYPTEITKHH
jgi:hypothetical protein